MANFGGAWYALYEIAARALDLKEGDEKYHTYKHLLLISTFFGALGYAKSSRDLLHQYVWDKVWPKTWCRPGAWCWAGANVPEATESSASLTRKDVAELMAGLAGVRADVADVKADLEIVSSAVGAPAHPTAADSQPAPVICPPMMRYGAPTDQIMPPGHGPATAATGGQCTQGCNIPHQGFASAEPSLSPDDSTASGSACRRVRPPLMAAQLASKSKLEDLHLQQEQAARRKMDKLDSAKSFDDAAGGK